MVIKTTANIFCNCRLKDGRFFSTSLELLSNAFHDDITLLLLLMMRVKLKIQFMELLQATVIFSPIFILSKIKDSLNEEEKMSTMNLFKEDGKSEPTSSRTLNQKMHGSEI